jgi:hypothetical protein
MMDRVQADQCGRELAWCVAKEHGLVDDTMIKNAGLLEGIMFAPLTALAALFSAPSGSRLHSMGLGFLLGAGMGAVTSKEVVNRQQQGENLNVQALSPSMKAILACISIGGSERAKKDVAGGKSMEGMSAMLAGAPLGAMMSADPATGLAVGGAASQLLSVLHASQIGRQLIAQTPGQAPQAQPTQPAQPQFKAQAYRPQ